MSYKQDQPPAYGASNPQQPPAAYQGGYPGQKQQWGAGDQSQPPQDRGYYQPNANMGYYQQQQPPPGAYYAPPQGGYPPPQGGYYPPQHQQQQSSSGRDGCLGALLGALACCCCLDILF